MNDAGKLDRRISRVSIAYVGGCRVRLHFDGAGRRVGMGLA